MPPISPLRRIPDPTIQKPPEPPAEIKPAEPVKTYEPKEVESKPSIVAPAILDRFKFTPPAVALPAILWPVIGIVVGLGLLWFGIFNAGSFYMQSSRMSGGLATFFYVYQVGAILEIIGVIVVWENLKKVRSILN